MRRRFVVGAVLTVPLVLIAMRGMLPGGRLLDGLADGKTFQWVEFALATPVVLWAGWPFFVRGVQSVVNRSLNMFTLIALGVSTAYLYSLAGIFVPQVFPAAMRDAEGLAGVYFEAGGGDRDPDPPRPGPGTAGPQPDKLRDQGAARARAEDREKDPRRRRGNRRPPRGGPGRRPAPGAAGREDARRRRRARGGEQRRRVDDLRRADPGREARRRLGRRGDGQRHRHARHPGREGRRRRPSSPASSGWWPRPSAAAPRSRSSPTSSRGISCRS